MCTPAFTLLRCHQILGSTSAAGLLNSEQPTPEREISNLATFTFVNSFPNTQETILLNFIKLKNYLRLTKIILLVHLSSSYAHSHSHLYFYL